MTFTRELHKSEVVFTNIVKGVSAPSHTHMCTHCLHISYKFKFVILGARLQLSVFQYYVVME